MYLGDAALTNLYGGSGGGGAQGNTSGQSGGGGGGRLAIYANIISGSAAYKDRSIPSFWWLSGISFW